MAIVEDVIVGEDGLVRRVFVRTAARARLERHTSSLVLLEATCDDEAVAAGSGRAVTGVDGSAEEEGVEVEEEQVDVERVSPAVAEETGGEGNGGSVGWDIDAHPEVLPPRSAKVKAKGKLASCM